MIPERFSVQVPLRALELLEATRGTASEMNLTTTHALTMAMPLIVIPLERGFGRSSLRDRKPSNQFAADLRQLCGMPFAQSPLWTASDAAAWRYLLVDDEHIDSPSQWSASLSQRVHGDRIDVRAGARSVSDILHVMRHGLSHGNVVYLDADGLEQPGRTATQIAFVARTSTASRRETWDGRHRVVVVEEEAFFGFLRSWCLWLQNAADQTGSLRRAA